MLLTQRRDFDTDKKKKKVCSISEVHQGQKKPCRLSVTVIVCTAGIVGFTVSLSLLFSISDKMLSANRMNKR